MGKDTIKINGNARFLFRSDTLANWESANPILLPGEIGTVTGKQEVGDNLEDKTEKIKIGDGIHSWNELDWWEKGPKGEKGEKGDNGNSGVYVGSGDMPDDCNVQIDPNGDADVVLSADEARKIVIDELAGRGQLKPEFANSVDECTDTSKLYVLPDGDIYAYMTKTDTVYPTNQIVNAIDSDGTEYNGGTGYKDDTRLSISSGETAQNGYTATGFIEVKQGDTIRFANINTTSTDSSIFIIFYDSSFSWIGYLRNEAATNALSNGICILNEDLTLSSGTLDGVSYFRVSMLTGDGDYFFTVNEPLEPTTTTTRDWHNTGHAFVADCNGTSTYTIEEAKRVANIVKEKQTVGSLTFSAMSDMHIRSNDSYWADNLTSCRDAGLGLVELQKLLKLDCSVMLGDYTVGGASDTVAQIKEDLTDVRDYIANGIKGVPSIWCTGNHDINYGKNSDRRMTEDEMFAYLINNNNGTTQDCNNIGRNYGYVDFENQKTRLIYLNTIDALDYDDITGTNDDCSEVTAIQTQWLVDVGLDFTAKADPAAWGIIVLSHHCLSIFPQVVNVLKGYKDGTDGTYNVTTNGVTTAVTYNFANITERAEVLCSIHGHNHNFMSKKISDEGYNKMTDDNVWLWSIGVPNMDTCRNNDCASYDDIDYANAFGEFDANGQPVYYEKTQGTAKSTSFCVITIDRKNRKVHATVYGAGYDREISY